MPNGLSVMGLLVCACAVIVFMLVGALSWQRNAYALAQQEVALRSALDQSGDEHQQLLAEQSRALNPRETAMHSANSGLNEFKLDERTAMVALKPKKTATPDNKTKPKPANAKPASTR